MGYTYYVESSQYEPQRPTSVQYGRTTERTPLGKALRWTSEKSLNEFLDSFLRIFLTGEWHVRLAGAVVTGVVAASAVWLASGTILPAVLGSSVAATAIGLGAAAGLAMGHSGGLLAGAGAGWLLSVIAESVSTELSKGELGLHVAPWATWCLSTMVGGLVGWAVGRLTGHIERRSTTAGLVLGALGYLLLFVSTAVVLVRTGAATAFWSGFAGPAETTGSRSDALAVGIGLGIIGGVLVARYLLWLVPRSGRTFRLHLPLSQAVVIAMLWTLAIFDSTSGSRASVAAVLTAVVWILPWAVALAIWPAVEARRRLSE